MTVHFLATERKTLQLLSGPQSYISHADCMYAHAEKCHSSAKKLFNYSI